MPAFGLGDTLLGVATGAVQLGLQPRDLGFELEHAPHAGEIESLVGELGDAPKPVEIGVAVAPVAAGGAGGAASSCRR